MVGHVRRAHRAEEDRVMVADPVATVGGHHHAVRLVIVGPPVEVVEPEPERPVLGGEGVEGLDAGRDDLDADAVGRDRRDGIGLHGKLRACG